MSQRPPASRPASRSPPESQRITLPSLQLRDDPQTGGRQDLQLHQQSAFRGYPSIQPSSQYGRASQTGIPEDDWRAAPVRDLAVHSILNPTEPDSGQETPGSSRRLSTGNTGSPISTVGNPPRLAPSPTGTHTFPGQHSSSDASPTQEGYRPTFPRSQPRSPRRILTPRSRAASAGRGQTTFDARGSPFIAQRGRAGYTAAPGHQDAPPLPTPPTHPQQQYGHTASEDSASMSRRLSMGSMQAPNQRPHSQSASPSISVSSANPSSSQTSPASFIYKGIPANQSGGSYFPGQSLQQAQGGGGMQFQAPSASGTEGPYSAPPPSAIASAPVAGSSRQTSDSIQVMTLTTSQGVYNVPVDVHHASRLADEKRARNAGASARFRQRRKEKEKEASTTIDKMQQQTRELERRVKQAEEERDFYRGERDRYRDAIFRTPEMRHMAMQAPPSPIAMRSGSFQGSQLGGPAPPTMSYQTHDGSAERPTRRRRTATTGEFTSVPYSLPPASTIAPLQTTGYAALPPTTLPPLRMENPSHQPVSTASTVPVTTSGASPSFDPYPRSGYERGWPGDSGRRL